MEGSFSSGAATSCSQCPHGQFAGSEGQGQCEFCNPGFIADTEGGQVLDGCDSIVVYRFAERVAIMLSSTVVFVRSFIQK